MLGNHEKIFVYSRQYTVACFASHGRENRTSIMKYGIPFVEIVRSMMNKHMKHHIYHTVIGYSFLFVYFLKRIISYFYTVNFHLPNHRLFSAALSLGDGAQDRSPRPDSGLQSPACYEQMVKNWGQEKSFYLIV